MSPLVAQLHRLGLVRESISTSRKQRNIAHSNVLQMSSQEKWRDGVCCNIYEGGTLSGRIPCLIFGNFPLNFRGVDRHVCGDSRPICICCTLPCGLTQRCYIIMLPSNFLSCFACSTHTSQVFAVCYILTFFNIFISCCTLQLICLLSLSVLHFCTGGVFAVFPSPFQHSACIVRCPLHCSALHCIALYCIALSTSPRLPSALLTWLAVGVSVEIFHSLDFANMQLGKGLQGMFWCRCEFPQSFVL